MHVVLTTVGTRGDVQPLAVLGEALQAAGHRATLSAPPDFRWMAEGRGLGFRPLGPNLAALAQGRLVPRHAAGHIVAAWHTFHATLREVVADTARDTLAACEDADLVVAGGVQFLGATAAERVGCPYAYAAMSPLSVRSPYVPPVFLSPWRTGRLANLAGWRLSEAFANAALLQPLNAARSSGELSPVRSVLAHAVWDQQVLFAFSRHVYPPAPDWSVRRHQVGYWLPDDRGWSAPDPLKRFLEAGPPPVYVGFGSMPLANPLRLLRVIVDAADQADVRIVLGGHWGAFGGPGGRPGARVFAVGDVPHGWLFPRMAAVVHQGGAGVTAEGIRAGAPAVVSPALGDQFFWARRVRDLNVGQQVPSVARLASDQLARAIRTVTDDATSRSRASDLAALVNAENGQAAAVAVLEDLAR